MPSPTIIFLDSHEDPATFTALAEFWPRFKGYIFSDELERSFTLATTIKMLEEKSTISERFQKGMISIQSMPAPIKETLKSTMAASKTFSWALQFYNQLRPQEYQAINFFIEEKIILENAGEGFRGILARDRLNACIYLRDKTVAKLGLQHLMSLQKSILTLAKQEFNLGLEQVNNLFVFVYLYSEPPNIESKENDVFDCDRLEERVRTGKTRFPLKLEQFDVSYPANVTGIEEQLFKIIDEKSAKLRQSPLRDFKEKNREKLEEITQKTFDGITKTIQFQCLKENLPVPPRQSYGICTSRQPGLTRKFSTMRSSVNLFPHRPSQLSPVLKIVQQGLSLLKK